MTSSSTPGAVRVGHPSPSHTSTGAGVGGSCVSGQPSSVVAGVLPVSQPGKGRGPREGVRLESSFHFSRRTSMGLPRSTMGA